MLYCVFLTILIVTELHIHAVKIKLQLEKVQLKSIRKNLYRSLAILQIEEVIKNGERKNGRAFTGAL